MLTEPVNASLPTNDKIAQLIGHQLVIAREHADGDVQIETRPLLPDIRRRQIDPAPPHGEFEPGIGQRRTHAVAQFLFIVASGSPTMTMTVSPQPN